jgi:hypothetical protein
LPSTTPNTPKNSFTTPQKQNGRKPNSGRNTPGTKSSTKTLTRHKEEKIAGTDFANVKHQLRDCCGQAIPQKWTKAKNGTHTAENLIHFALDFDISTFSGSPNDERSGQLDVARRLLLTVLWLKDVRSLPCKSKPNSPCRMP